MKKLTDRRDWNSAAAVCDFLLCAERPESHLKPTEARACEEEED